MTTVDNLLLKIVNHNVPTIEEILPSKDSKVLRSLATSISSHFFITENQSKLLMKILRENSKKITDFSEEIFTALNNPTWSKNFREIEQVRKIYISKNEDGESIIFIEFTFSSEIRKILQNLGQKLDNLVATSSQKIWTCDLTEKNIVGLVENLSHRDFTIDEVIKNHYTTIKSWSENEVRNQFLITNMTNTNFHKAITDDLGIATEIDQNIITDRSMRYQYFTENAKNHGETLTEVIASRSKSRIWIDKNQHSLNEVVASLVELKRLPMLVVFDTIVNNKYLENMEFLSDALKKNGIFDGVGIYFRLPNDDMGKKFNNFIAEHKYNQQLDETSKVAGVMSGKIPKFFLKNAWKPLSVITLGTKMGLRHGKTSVYANCCDCIVEWSEDDTMFDKKVLLK